jgi:hypothetical protein
VGDGRGDGEAFIKPVGSGVADDAVGSGDAVSADGPGLGLVEANDGDGEGEADELAQPARRDRHTSDDARSLSIRGPSATAV